VMSLEATAEDRQRNVRLLQGAVLITTPTRRLSPDNYFTSLLLWYESFRPSFCTHFMIARE